MENISWKLLAHKNSFKSIYSKKYRDLSQLLKLVPVDFHYFYKNVKHSCTSDEFNFL
jgi:hypothetical protein